MTDRIGMTYEELLKIQEQHLALWAERVRPEIIEDVAAYVRATNQPATDPTQAHQVFRGQTIIELIRTWPVINPHVYPAPHTYPSKQCGAEAMV